MKKVLIFCEGLWHRAGIERMTVELANLLADETEITIVTIDPFDISNCPFEIKKGINVISLNSKFHKSLINLNINNIRNLRKIIREIKPDTLITVATPLVRISAPAVAGLGIKNIAWEHFNLFAGSKIGSAFKIVATHFVDTTVALTEADAEDFRNAHAPRVISIPNFTSIGVNEPSECIDKIALAVGRHERQKGFDLLLQAWAKADVADWKLRIVGSGSLREQNEKLSRELGISDKVDFVDSHNNIANDFQHASCFILSSRFEGMVLVLLEAKMMGLPCISFDCPNSPREVIRDGIDGWLVENGNVEALAQTLTEKLRDMEILKRFGGESRKDAIAKYTAAAVKEKWLQLI